MAEDRTLNKIRGLLAQAEDESTTEAEREAFMERAYALMLKYGIEEAVARATEEKQVKPEIPCDWVQVINGGYAAQKVTLYFSILKIFGGDAVRTQSGAETKIHCFAYEADRQLVDMLYTSLVLQGTSASKYVPSWENARSYRTGFWYGFTNIVVGRLRAAYEKAEKEAGTALVLQSREVAVKSAMYAAHPSTKKISRRVNINPSGYRGGQEAGRRANIHDRQSTGAGQARAVL